MPVRLCENERGMYRGSRSRGGDGKRDLCAAAAARRLRLLLVLSLQVDNL